MAKTKQLPAEILVYICDRLDDGSAVYAVALNVDEIPEDQDGAIVGNYTINRAAKFKVRRELT